jgi:hypothetical protein
VVLSASVPNELTWPVARTDFTHVLQGGNMSTPTGGNAFLNQLEVTVRAELTQAETSQPEQEAAGVPIDEWLSDPADDQRYEVGLRALIGAVEALEEVPGNARAVGYPPDGPDQRAETEGW